MTVPFKKVVAPFVFAAFLTTTFFSFAGMTYGSDGRMQGDCPFSAAGASLCPSSALPGAIHHIDAVHSFLNVPVNSALAALMISLLIGILVFSPYPFLYRPPAPVSYTPTPFTSEDRKIKRWLSLFENSPSR
ncbi:hypothetical protein HY972_00555 [Candidatus Kaiserbacteria bacterium]|nr:hypothetical protein [Candidatus Kaiserbacteria bacterium]